MTDHGYHDPDPTFIRAGRMDDSQPWQPPPRPDLAAFDLPIEERVFEVNVRLADGRVRTLTHVTGHRIAQLGSIVFGLADEHETQIWAQARTPDTIHLVGEVWED